MNFTRLNPICEDIWEYDYVYPKPPLHIRMRMTVVRLSSGGLWLYSPNPIDERLAQELATLGPIEHIVAPNNFHDLFLKKIKGQFPEAKLWAAPGLSQRRSDIPFDDEIKLDIQMWLPDLEMKFIEGSPRMNEVVFYHSKSRTLICADFLSNVHVETKALMKFVWRAMGAWKKLNQSRTWRFMVKDKHASRQSVQQILQWDIQRIVMAHGEVVENPGERLKSAFAWLD
jgi:hypothetical protein